MSAHCYNLTPPSSEGNPVSPDVSICPILPENLNVRGKFGELLFDYVEIRVNGCDLGDSMCAPDDLIT